MKLQATSVIVLTCAMAGAAAGQQTPLPGGIPLNQIMPQLPPVPEPTNRLPRQSHQPCANPRAEIPTGDTTEATTASPTPGGIGLYGEEGPDNSTAPSADSNAPCPPSR